MYMHKSFINAVVYSVLLLLGRLGLHPNPTTPPPHDPSVCIQSGVD